MKKLFFTGVGLSTGIDDSHSVTIWRQSSDKSRTRRPPQVRLPDWTKEVKERNKSRLSPLLTFSSAEGNWGKKLEELLSLHRLPRSPLTVAHTNAVQSDSGGGDKYIKK